MAPSSRPGVRRGQGPMLYAGTAARPRLARTRYVPCWRSRRSAAGAPGSKSQSVMRQRGPAREGLARISRRPPGRQGCPRPGSPCPLCLAAVLMQRVGAQIAGGGVGSAHRGVDVAAADGLDTADGAPVHQQAPVGSSGPGSPGCTTYRSTAQALPTSSVATTIFPPVNVV